MNTYTTLKGLLAVAPKNDIRYCLNAICLTGSKLIASDGHIMLLADQAFLGVEEPIIICRLDLDRKLKMFTKKTDCELTVVDGKPFLNEFELDTVDGRYPDIERVCGRYRDSGLSGEPLGLDLKLISKLSKAIDVICDSKGSAAEFRFHGPYMGCSIHKFTVSGYLAPCRL